MKGAIFFCSVLAFAASKPNGLYHQEYNYKSSSSSYKNNELQHQNEDNGFYSKDGDLEGRLKPKVNSHSQHSEYINPKLRSGSSNYQDVGGFSSGSNGDYRASSDRLFGTNLNGFSSGGQVDGYASSDRITDLSNVFPSGGGYGTSMGGYGSNQRGYGSTFASYGASTGGGYGSSLGESQNFGHSQGGTDGYYRQKSSAYNTAGTYGTNTNLNSLAQRLQDDMSRQLENAIQKQYSTSGYSTSVSNSQMTTDIRALEDELKRNLTRQLQDSLRSQYGQQQTRGSDSYTIIEGTPSTVINYNNQELADMTRRLEDTLIRKLHQNVRTTYNRETVNGYSTSSNNYAPIYTSSSTYRPYYERPAVMIPSNIRYTPVSNPESITNIASRIQTNVNSNLDTALHNLYSTFLQTGGNSYQTLTDFDNEVNRIRSDIVRNLTSNLDDQIRRNYGQQVLKGDYYYSISTTGETSPQYNYNIKDYDSLRKQVEENLIKKLDQTINTYRDQYQRQQSYTTNTNAYTVTYRPTYYTSGGQTYDYSDLQRQLSQQLNNALNKHRYSQSSSYSSSTSYNPQAYQNSLDELTRELQRNLTEQLNNYRASSSSSGYSYTSGFNGGSADFESMKNQLQNQLMQQLQQGLQKQHRYSASASYSASSSSSSKANYGTRQAYGNYGNYMECCQGDDPTAYSNNRNKRAISHSNRSYQSTKSSSFSIANKYSSLERRTGGQTFRPLGYGNSINHNMQDQQTFSSHYQPTHSYPEVLEDVGHDHRIQKIIDNQQQELTGQQLEDDLNQQLELSEGHPGKLHHLQFVGQERGDDSTQKLELDHQRSRYTGQQEDDFTQQLELHSIKHPAEIPQYTQDQQLVENHLQDGNQLGWKDEFQPKNFRYHGFSMKHPEDLSQQLELEAPTSKHSYVLEQKQQKAEHITTQHLELNHVKPQKLEQDLFGQQLEDQNEQHLELTDLHQPISKKQIYNQEIERQQIEDSNGHLELSNAHNPNQQQEQYQDDLTQKQELEQQHNGQDRLPQELELERLRQELENFRPPPLTLNTEQKTEINQQLQELDDLNQQLELEKKKPINEKPHVPYANQHLSNSQKPKTPYLQSPEQQQVDASQLELTDIPIPQLEQEIVGPKQKPKPFDSQILEEPNQQSLVEQPDLTQQLQLERESENSNPKYSQEIQKDDLTQQLELTDSRRPKQKLGQQLEDQDQILEDQFEKDLTQQLMLNDVQKPKSNQEQELQQQIEDDLTQQLELTDSKNSKQDFPSSQQLENQDRILEKQYEKDVTQQLIMGNIQEPKNKKTKFNQEQELQQQIEDDSTQQLEVSHVHKIPHLEDQTLKNNVTQQLELTPPSELNTLNQHHQDILGQHIEKELTGQFLEDLYDKPNNKKPKNVQQQVKDDLQQQVEDDLTQQKLESDQQLPEQEQKLELTDTYLKKTERPKVIREQQVEDLDTKKPNEADQIAEKDNLDQQLELTDSKKIKDEKLDHDEQRPVFKPNYHETQPVEDVMPSELSHKDVGYDVDQHLDTPNTDHEQKPIGHQFHGFDIHKPSVQIEKIGGQSQYSSSDHKVVTQTQINQSRHHPIHTITVYGTSPPNSFSQSESHQRTFTNGHSGHVTGGNNNNNFEDALRQQDALIDLLKQKLHSKPANQEGYGQRTIKKTVYVNGTPISSSENRQFIKPNGEVIESGNTSPFSPLDGNTFSQNIYGGRVGNYGANPQQDISSKTTSFSGNTIRRTTHHVNGNSATSGNVWSPFEGRLPEESSLSHGFNSGQAGSSYHFSETGTPQFTGKTTKRVIHFVNGKPVSASEQIQVLKPNGEVVESNHKLPLNEDLLRQKLYPSGISSHPFKPDIDSFNPSHTYNYGVNTVGLSGHTTKNTLLSNGNLRSSDNIYGTLTNPHMDPVEHLWDDPDSYPVEIGNNPTFPAGMIENQIADKLEQSSGYKSRHTSGVKTSQHFESTGY